MSMHDGESATEETLEKIGGYFTVALTVALRAAETVSHRHAEERRHAEQEAELARRRVERQQAVEATAARHQLRDVGSKGWWDKSTDAEIAAGYALARAYGQIDMELAGTAEYMAEEITRRYGVDPEVYVARAEREATELRAADWGAPQGAREAREEDLLRDKLVAFDFEMARDYGERWADRDDLPVEAGARIRAHEEAMAADRWVTAAQERIEAASAGPQLTPATEAERAAAGTSAELSRMYGKDWFTQEDVSWVGARGQQIEAAREWARRESFEAAALVAEANRADTVAGTGRGPGTAAGRGEATRTLTQRLDGAGISGEARKARLAVDTAQPRTVTEAVTEGRGRGGKPARGPRLRRGAERGR